MTFFIGLHSTVLKKSAQSVLEELAMKTPVQNKSNGH